MDPYLIWLGGFIIIFTILSKVEDWIAAWRGASEETSNMVNDFEDEVEAGYNDASGWLVYGHSVEVTQTTLVTAYSTADYDEGVWDAIRDWELLQAKHAQEIQSIKGNL